METYATELTYAIPGFIVLILIELMISRWMGKPVNRIMDSISSLSSGMTNTLKDVLGLSVVIISYGWMVDKIALFDIQSTLWLYLLAIVGIDFAAYWSHRFNHEFNVLWNRHVIHHSSEEFNLSCALRQPISTIFGVYFFLYIPMAFIGIPSEVIAVTAPLHLFAQFWYHTRLIGRMGFLEHIIVTPSHHRVHHAINPEYIDKNYAAIFILWDKWFGTFQEEKANIAPVYGVKRQVKTWNPILINFQHIWLLFQDSWRTKNIWDKIRLWFMPTGWRPEDVNKTHPVEIVQDVFKMEKYEPSANMLLKAWSLLQLIIANLFLFYMLIRIADFPFTEILFYALFLFLSIFSYSSLMDRSKIAFPFEIVKTAFAFFLLYHMNGWYGLDEYILGGSTVVVGYLVISTVLSFYFSYLDSAGKRALPV